MIGAAPNETFALTVTSAASTSDPVITAADAKLHIKQDDTADDALISSLIFAATEALQRHCRRQFVTATMKLNLDVFPGGSNAYPSFLRIPGATPNEYCYGDTIYVPRPPLQSVSSIKYIDSSGTQVTLSSTLYQVDSNSEPGRIVPSYNNVWPATRVGYLNAVEVIFVAGYGAASAVPEGIKQAIRLLVAHWYENREEVTIGQQGFKLPRTVDALLSAFAHGGMP